jgi:hypothetical protein
MTQDEIIELARQAGMMTRVLYLGRNFELLTDFAKLVAAHTLMHIDPSKFMSHQEGIEAGRLAEREAIIDLVAMYGGPVDLEAAIRARGQT